MSRLDCIASRFAIPVVRWIALLLICGAYLQGGLTKVVYFDGAIAEMSHFGLAPAVPFAVGTIVLELAASMLILTGYYRWIGALALAVFTFGATFLANRFWELSEPDRFMATNAFFEHLGLVGAFVLIAWHDLRARPAS
ncbi:MAG: DoxX family protein [Steroidobacteraceae bacterium]